MPYLNWMASIPPLQAHCFIKREYHYKLSLSWSLSMKRNDLWDRVGYIMNMGKKSGCLLAHQLKSKSAAQIISQIEDATGEITTDPLKINDTFKKFYSDLYKSESLKDVSLFQNFFKTFETPTLSSNHREYLDQLMELGEIRSAISAMHLFSNIRRLINVLYSPSSNDSPEVVVSLDAEKAFNCVEWDFLFFVLKKFGFVKTLINWIQLLYSSPQASVITNQMRSQSYSLSRGTRQGWPLSPLLFTLAIEPLALVLKSTPSIHGTSRWGLEMKVSLYADDMLLYISDPLQCISIIISVLHTFGQISGYKLNLTKSGCLPINKLAVQFPDHALPFHISRSGFKYLGINITPSFKNLFDGNFAPLISKLKSDLQRWDILHLTLAGRVNCVKMNVLPRFLFLFQCIPIFLSKSFFCHLTKWCLDSYGVVKNLELVRISYNDQEQEAGWLCFRGYSWAANVHKIPSTLHALVSSNLPMKILHQIWHTCFGLAIC